MKPRYHANLTVLLAALLLSAGLTFTTSRLAAAPATPAASPYAGWSHGPSTNADYFPIAVWLQHPKNAPRYRAAGINLFIGLWRGPTEEQLAQLKSAHMPVICAQNKTGLAQRDNPIIVGWMHEDEPDNAQSLGPGKGYGPPITPETVQRDYHQLRQADPTRPVLLNLGQGVAYDNYIGRGVRRNRMEDYPEYVKGADIVSFDIYPVVHDKPEIAGRLEYVARGVERLVQWTGGQKTVWNCIECTRIGNVKIKPNPEQVRAEVWMSLIHGSRGLIYFVHQFAPEFKEAALLDDPEMLAAVTRINQQIHELAPVLNSPTLTNLVQLTSSNTNVPVATLTKDHGGARYVFAVAMRDAPTTATITLGNAARTETVEVLGESRQLAVRNGQFTDTFPGYGVHLYRIPLR